jgi:hypothetical protein
LTNPSLFECHAGGDPPLEVQGTVYLSESTEGWFSSSNITESRSQIDGPAGGASDGVFFYLAGSGSKNDRCFGGTFFRNSGRTGGHAETRTTVEYDCCNFVNNSQRYNVLYQGQNGRTTLNRCIFVKNSNKDGGFAGLGYGFCDITDCVFDGLPGELSVTVSFSTGMVVGRATATNTQWHLNTDACPGFRSPTGRFTLSGAGLGRTVPLFFPV